MKHLTNAFLFRIFGVMKTISQMSKIRKIDT